MFCSHCGKEVVDDAVICTNCGRVIDVKRYNEAVKSTEKRNSGLSVAARIFMVLGCIVNFFVFWAYGTGILMAITDSVDSFWGAIPIALLSLVWCLPMTVKYFLNIKNGERTGVCFKIFSLLFVSMIAGILMLCDEVNENQRT